MLSKQQSLFTGFVVFLSSKCLWKAVYKCMCICRKLGIHAYINRYISALYRERERDSYMSTLVREINDIVQNCKRNGNIETKENRKLVSMMQKQKVNKGKEKLNYNGTYLVTEKNEHTTTQILH